MRTKYLLIYRKRQVSSKLRPFLLKFYKSPQITEKLFLTQNSFYSEATIQQSSNKSMS